MTADLSVQIAKLLTEKQQHSEALRRIDETLQKVGSLLGLGVQAAERRGRGRPPKSSLAIPQAKAQPTQPLRGKRRWFAVTAEQSILDFVGKGSSPTTKEVNQHWKVEGRGGTADNTLSLMVKKKTLKRLPMEGRHGSRYAVA